MQTTFSELAFNTRTLRHIRCLLPRDVANTSPAVSSARIDYCNALLSGADEGVPDKLKHVWNRLAQTACKYGVRDHYTIEVLRELHWLPVRSHITFKVSMLCYKVQQFGNPLT